MYTVLKNGKDYDTVLAEIDLLNINQIWQGVFELMYPMHEYENNNTTYTKGQDQPYYDGLQIYQMVAGEKVYGVKLAFSDYETEEAGYKQSLKDAETIWFNETQRVNDLTIRIDALYDWREASIAAQEYDSINEYSLFKDSIIGANDTTALDIIEAQDSINKQSYDFEQAVDQKINDIAFGNRVVAYISKMNLDNNITAEQLTTIYSNSDILSLMSTLQSGSLNTALALTQGLDLTGLEPITEIERTFVVTKLQEYLGI